MPITQKSNIRSRWYRAKRKTIESGEGKAQLNEPKEKFLISENEKLIDDLSSVNLPPQERREEKRTLNHRNKK